MADEKVSYYTQQGFEKATKELQRLMTEEREKLSKAMADARDKGDLSENAEFDAAKEAQELLEKKIAELQLQLSNARILSEDNISTSEVSILNKVKIKNITNGMQLTYTIVPQTEANFKEGKISIKSPIGQGLLGKKVGEKASIKVPAGEITFEILDISL